MSIICDDKSSQIPSVSPTKFFAKCFQKINFVKYLRPHVVANNFGIFWKPNFLHNLLGKLNSFISKIFAMTFSGTAKFSPFIFYKILNVRVIAMTCCRNYVSSQLLYTNRFLTHQCQLVSNIIWDNNVVANSLQLTQEFLAPFFILALNTLCDNMLIATICHRNYFVVVAFSLSDYIFVFKLWNVVATTSRHI